ncbi:MAG: 5'-nucleotidase C-terminal domain-containing protein [Desulfobacterales bacterium]|nr:5'-nucleotidase C-terminal domain-containing protein [Desulfobacterales bacterium]
MKYFRFIVYLSLVYCGLIFNAFSQNTQLKIIYASNMPDIEIKEGVGGLPELASLLKDARSANENVLFLYGGDSLAPSALSSFDKGTHIISLLNSLEPSAMAVAKREFTYKEDELILRTYEASFPMLNANIYDPITKGNMEGLETYQCFNIGNYKICIFAVIDPEILIKYRPKRIEIRDTLEVIKKTAREIRKQGADIIILMTDYLIPNVEELLSSELINIILKSDSNEDSIFSNKNGIYIRQGTDKRKAAIIDLFLEGKKDSFKWKYDVKMSFLNEYKPDKDILKQVQSYLLSLSKLMDVVIGVTSTPLDTTRESVRTSENAFGNLIADAVREYYGADISLINGGGIRGKRKYPAGSELTRKDIQAELPFPNSHIIIRVTGSQILEALESGFSAIDNVSGGFPHVSGMTVTYSKNSPVGKRVRSVIIDGKPLKLDSKYVMATLDFIADGGDGYDALKNSEHLSHASGSQILWDTVRSYIESKKNISPKIEGRLIEISN